MGAEITACQQLAQHMGRTKARQSPAITARVDGPEAALVQRLRDAKLLTDAGHLTLRQISVLALAAGAEQAQRTVAARAARMGVSKPAVTRAADRLTALGFVKRRWNNQDLRVVFIDITKDGATRLPLVMAALHGEAAAGRVAA